jgi:hypothetical protein
LRQRIAYLRHMLLLFFKDWRRRGFPVIVITHSCVPNLSTSETVLHNFDGSTRPYDVVAVCVIKDRAILPSPSITNSVLSILYE